MYNELKPLKLVEDARDSSRALELRIYESSHRARNNKSRSSWSYIHFDPVTSDIEVEVFMLLPFYNFIAIPAKRPVEKSKCATPTQSLTPDAR